MIKLISKGRFTWERLGAGASGAAVAGGLCSITVSQILLAIAVVLTIGRWRETRFPKAFWCLPVFFALTLISAVHAGDLVLAWPYLRKFFVFLIVPCIATTFYGIVYARRVLAAIGAVGLLSAGWSFVQYTRKYISITASGGDFARMYVGNRITGFMGHWMTFSGEMMVVFLLAAAYVLFAKRYRWKLALVSMVIAAAILLGQTRGIWIGSFAGAVYLLWSYRARLALLAPVVAGLAIFAAPHSVQDRAVSIIRPRGDMDSNAHRLALLRTGERMIMAHPLLGVGPERVRLEFDQYAPPDIPRPFPATWYIGHLHNIYVQFAAERGIPAMLSFIGFIMWACWRTARRAHQALNSEFRWMLHGIAAAIIGILVSGFFEHNMGDSEVLQLALGLQTVGVFLANQVGQGLA